MRKKIFTLLAVVWTIAAMATDIPRVYNVENTGVNCTPPLFPAVSELPSIVRLPNPFMWADGHGTVGSFDDWKCRRAEIKAEIEHYEIGVKPNRPADISATYSNGKLTVTINDNGKTVTLTSNVTVPSGTGPFPIVIGMNSPTGSLSSSLFSDCIQIPFVHDQVATYSMSGTKDLNAPFYQMYPKLSSAGDYCAWAWGVSRLIDGIEIVKQSLNADLEHIAVTGCSYAGKMALFAGAFDERIALTIAQESGGGGIASWRVSETLGSVENINSTNYSWFMPDLKNNFNGKVEKLPYDHHELIAMIAPRAFLALGNDGWTWLADKSGYVACMAAREVWKFMGIEDRFGFDFTGGHNHCDAAASQITAVTNFVDKFLRGKNDVNTTILTSPYQNENYQFWISDWSNAQEPSVALEQYWYEAESVDCAIVGSDFVVKDDNGASNGKYVTAKDNLNSMNSAPDVNGLITIPFTVNNPHDFYIYFRLNCPNNGDSFWVKIDNGAFVAYDGLTTNGEWKWKHLLSPTLLAGNHTLTIGYRASGAKLDRIYIANDLSVIPEGMGGKETECVAKAICTILDFESGNITGWTKQNPGREISITQEDKHSGEYALKMTNAQGTDAWSVQAFSPEVEMVSGHVYNVSFWVRAVDGGGRGRISTTGAGQLGSSQYWADFTAENSWKQITYTNLTAAGNTIRLAFDMGYIANKTYYIDDIVFEDITVDPKPAVKVQGASWDAGKVTINKNVHSGVFSIRNIGTGVLEVTETTQLTTPWATTFKTGDKLSLKAGQVQEFTFTYAPISASVSTANFNIHTNGGNAVIELRGEGTTDDMGISDIDNQSVKVFSPATGKLNVMAPENSKVKITDVIGRMVETDKVLHSPSVFYLHSGSYVVSVVSGNRVYTQKVIVK